MSLLDTNRRKLIETLRSGKYKQGKFFLRRANECFCVVGVMADLYDPTKWIPTEMNHCWAYGGASQFLPDAEVLKTFGLTRYNDVKENSAMFWINKSDSGVKFEEIADIMEEKWFPGK